MSPIRRPGALTRADVNAPEGHVTRDKRLAEMARVTAISQRVYIVTTLTCIRNVTAIRHQDRGTILLTGIRNVGHAVSPFSPFWPPLPPGPGSARGAPSGAAPVSGWGQFSVTARQGVSASCLCIS